MSEQDFNPCCKQCGESEDYYGEYCKECKKNLCDSCVRQYQGNLCHLCAGSEDEE